MSIRNSLEYQTVRRDLVAAMSQVGHNPDLSKFLNNIDKVVSELSKAEVQGRRTGSSRVADSKLTEINDAIKRLEQFILIAALMK